VRLHHLINKKALAELKRLFSVYCLIDHSYDSDSPEMIIFTQHGRWTPSYCLVLKNTDGHVEAIYQEFDKFNELYKKNETNKLFFQGFSFELEPSRWTDLVLRAEALLSTSTENGYTDDTTDATDYVLSYNGQASIVNSGSEEARYVEFSKYLNDAIINPVKNLRKPPCEE
jgi:hypothetical protein